MKKIITLILIVAFGQSAFAQKIKADEIKVSMKRVADWQIAHFKDTYSGRQQPHHPLFWANGVLYIGMAEWAKMSNDNFYWEWLKNIAEENSWKLHERLYHADDHTVGQLYVELYRKYKDEKMIAPLKEQFRYINFHPANTSLLWVKNKDFKHDRWSWCDALFMAPPAWAQLYNITKDEMYLNFLMKEFKATTDYLYDKDERLYYRDQSYMGKNDHGTKVFWSRGNGWVFAGLVNVMKELPAESEEYEYFLGIYKQMAERLIELQTKEGHWAMSLLGEEFYPTPEASGTSFYVYGLAWGINNGVLSEKKYKTSVKKGWNALVSYINDDGMLGYVQPIGAAPGNAWPDKTEVYGAGAFLSAGVEVFKMVNQ